MTDLRNTKVLIAVFAMPGCGACDEYLPRFGRQVRRFQQAGAPFHIWHPGDEIVPGMIPVLIYDAAADNAELQAFADRLKIVATPTTAMLTRPSVVKVEGAIDDAQIEQLLRSAAVANR